VSNLCKYCGGTQHTLYEGETDPYTVDEYHWRCSVCGNINLKSDYEEVGNTSDFVGLLNKEMEDLINDYAKRRIADLEAKFAESEKQCRECRHLNKKIELNIKNKLMAENGELQKQLAEKDWKN